jgi:hypothetical protein
MYMYIYISLSLSLSSRVAEDTYRWLSEKLCQHTWGLRDFWIESNTEVLLEEIQSWSAGSRNVVKVHRDAAIAGLADWRVFLSDTERNHLHAFEAAWEAEFGVKALGEPSACLSSMGPAPYIYI